MLSPSLNSTAEYALRAMTSLALESKNCIINSRDLSGKTRVPVHYLNKIMNRLMDAELVTSIK
jgi:DNA-binding IscR family transcriptional regulator